MPWGWSRSQEFSSPQQQRRGWKDNICALWCYYSWRKIQRAMTQVVEERGISRQHYWGEHIKIAGILDVVSKPLECILIASHINMSQWAASNNSKEKNLEWLWQQLMPWYNVQLKFWVVECNFGSKNIHNGVGRQCDEHLFKDLVFVLFQLKARAVTHWRHNSEHGGGGELSVFCWWASGVQDGRDASRTVPAALWRPATPPTTTLKSSKLRKWKLRWVCVASRRTATKKKDTKNQSNYLEERRLFLLGPSECVRGRLLQKWTQKIARLTRVNLRNSFSNWCVNRCRSKWTKTLCWKKKNKKSG